MNARHRRRIGCIGAGVAVMLAALLGGCGTVASVPQDVFLRLPPPGETAARTPAMWTDAAVRVAPLRASGVFKERALVATDEAGVVLRQHRYLYWQDGPETLLQHALAARLRAAGVAPVVVTGPDPDAALEVEGRIEAFERIEAPAGGRTRVVLELSLQDSAAREPLLRERYEAQTVAAERGPEATAAAMGAAVDAVVTRFLVDAATAMPGDSPRERR